MKTKTFVWVYLFESLLVWGWNYFLQKKGAGKQKALIYRDVKKVTGQEAQLLLG